jgi:hypothetical protein
VSEPSLLIEAMYEDELLPLARELNVLLGQAEAVGRVLADVWVLLSSDVPTTGGPEIIGGAVHCSREITVPAEDDDVRQLARSWHREIQRELGIHKYEPSAGYDGES